MAKTNKSKKTEEEQNLQHIEKSIESLTDTLSTLTNSLGPLMNMGNISTDIEKLKDIVPKKKDLNEGETCMHGNSWNSSCTDCEAMNGMDHVFEMVRQTPDDAELGAKVRGLYNTAEKLINSDTSEEDTDD
tara:strand:- start:17 stop:409 length:393 start_codon:yes stop_codon:yes gene_type:complete